MKKYCSIIIIGCILPFVILGVCEILPTFDDYVTLQSPQFTSPLSKKLLPYDSFWRPWDYLFGCLLGWNIVLFPTLNHVVIILGHTANAVLVFAICRKLNICIIATNVATTFFFFSPASLGATLACDGLNQTYAQFWGLIALWCYLVYLDNYRLFIWLPFTFIAALSKENGLSWAIIPPLIAFAFNLIEKNRALKHIGLGLLLTILYFFLRIILKVNNNINDDYIEVTLVDHFIDFVQILVYNWLPVDYMSIVYKPERNWLLVGLTLFLSIFFLGLLGTGIKKLWKDRIFLILTVCYFIVAAPHLLTLVSIMHNYATLSISALITAYIINKPTKMLYITFSLYIIASLFTDVHHYIGAYQSGLLGKQMAFETIDKTGYPVQQVFCITIEDDYTPKYSSFRVRPIDAFGWGLSVRHYTGYTWPTIINGTILKEKEVVFIQQIADSALQSGAQCVWVIDNNQVKVISSP